MQRDPLGKGQGPTRRSVGTWGVRDRSILLMGFLGGPSGKEHPPASAGDRKDTGLIPGSGRSPGGGHGNHSSVLAWRIPWTEEPGGLQSMESQRVRHD